MIKYSLIKQKRKINYYLFFPIFFIFYFLYKLVFFHRNEDIKTLEKKNNTDLAKNNRKIEMESTNQIEIIEKNDIPPEKFERNIFEEIKEKIKGNTLMVIPELYFISGLIRKYKPKKILEVGVCTGGVSATILNSIKDIEDSRLYSCDLEKKHYFNKNYEVGYVVKKYFPQFLNKWKLYTGNTTAAFIEEIGNEIDLAFIDTAHVMPGEVLNILEILPFLRKNAIIVLDDIHHQSIDKEIKMNNFHSSNNLLISVLRGQKIIYNQAFNETFSFSKLGAVILDDNQKKYYYEYFYLLTNNWSYMPQNFEIVTIRNIIEKYYDPFFLSIFDKAVEMNYKHLKMKGLLTKDYMFYTFPDRERKKPF